jgi:hypothetical protein
MKLEVVQHVDGVLRSSRVVNVCGSIPRMIRGVTLVLYLLTLNSGDKGRVHVYVIYTAIL